MTDEFVFSALLFGGISVFLYGLVLLDWLGRRKERKSEHRPAG